MLPPARDAHDVDALPVERDPVAVLQAHVGVLANEARDGSPNLGELRAGGDIASPCYDESPVPGSRFSSSAFCPALGRPAEQAGEREEKD
jgi:hypothetical protein